MPSFKTNLDLQKHQLLNPVLHNLTTLPSTPVEGQMCYDSGKKLAYIWNGTVWAVWGETPPPPQIIQFTYHIQGPLKGSLAQIVRLYQNLTVLRIDSHITSGTSVSFHVEYRSSVNVTGTNVTTSPMLAVNAGTTTTSFSNAALPANAWLYLNIADISGTIGLLTITITVTTS